MRLSLISAVLAPIFLATVGIAQEATHSAATIATQSQASPSNNDQAKPAKDENSPHRYHLRLGTVALNAGYVAGPLWYPYAPYAYYPYYGAAFDPFWAPFSPYYYPSSFAYGVDKGQIELKADPKDAAVYIDGAYAGTVPRLKNIWLDPGAYDLSIRATGREPFQQRVYVLTGKTLNISAKLTPVTGAKEEKQ
ncbi:MAG TPA: PEGA domain-containing protein [Terriglobales bacterium]|nr:PEGA domain-containing protein [Terriglobales bacterium]